jgi:ankyrin repeat protein
MSKALKAAIDANDAAAARKALKTVKDLSRKLPKAAAPLEYACQVGADQVIAPLLEAGAPMPDDKEFFGHNPFYIAVDNGRINVMKELLAHATIPPETIEPTLIHQLHVENAEMVQAILDLCKPPITTWMIDLTLGIKGGKLFKLLIERGRADVNVREVGKNNKDSRGETPMHKAARDGYVESIQRLVDAGADLNAQDNLGRTPLMQLATRIGEIETATRARIERANKPPSEFMLKLQAQQRERRPHKGETEDADGIESLKLLLKLGADATIKDRFGNDALTHHEWEAMRGREGIVEECVRLLTEAGATGGGATLQLITGGGATLQLIKAVRADDIAAAEDALEAGADVNHLTPPPGSGSPLMFAKSAAMVEVLLKAGADPNKPTLKTTPLIDAAGDGNLEIVKLLVRAGADLHALDPREPESEFIRNAYLAAEMNRKHDVVDYLKSLGGGQPRRKDWKPVTAGVHMWENFDEILVKGDVAAVANGLAKMIEGTAEMNGYGKRFTRGQRAFVVIRPKGMSWTNVFRVAPAPRRFEDFKATEKLCKAMASTCGAPVLSIGYSDTAGAAQIVRFEPDGTSTRDDGWDRDTLQEMIDAMGDEAPAWARERLKTMGEKTPDSSERLKLLAVQERFAVAAFNFQCDPGRPIEIDVAGYPAEAFDGAAFVTSA